MQDAHARFRVWFDQSGLNQLELSRRLGCHHSYIPHLLSGAKLPGRLIAHAIERESASWAEGPICAEEWDAVEISRRSQSTGTDDA